MRSTQPESRMKVDAFSTLQKEFFPGEPEPDYWALKDWLGADTLDPEYVNVIDIDDLQDMQFVDYLIEGYDVTGEDIASHRAALDGLRGHVAIVTSAAFGGVEQDLKANTDALTLENTFLIHAVSLRQRSASISFRPLPRSEKETSLGRRNGRACGHDCIAGDGSSGVDHDQGGRMTQLDLLRNCHLKECHANAV